MSMYVVYAHVVYEHAVYEHAVYEHVMYEHVGLAYYRPRFLILDTLCLFCLITHRQ
jgi:hypothetical protein